ncbi:NUDIX domain-containing protein [Patescibacteria group bacterium]|nr:NUDIX domain-containing protein [Patescibacteria group bacterium]
MFRKGVSALILNKNQEFLVVNLVSFEDQFFAIPGGGVEEGETVEQAVYREIEEELGIEKDVLEIVGICKDPLQFKFKTKKLERDGIEYEGSERYFFGFRFIGNESDISLQENEVRSYKWVCLEDLKNYLLFDI